MNTITRARALILTGAMAGAVTFGAVAASGDAGDTGSQQQRASATSTADRAPSALRAETRTERERGIVLEGTGTWHGQDVAVSVYENSKHGNALQIVLGNPDAENAIGAGEGRHAYVIDGVLNVGLEVDGDLAVVEGTVDRAGTARPVAERDADGDLVRSRGTRVPLLVDATFTYRGDTVDLEFSRAFRYDLRSARVVGR